MITFEMSFEIDVFKHAGFYVKASGSCPFGHFGLNFYPGKMVVAAARNFSEMAAVSRTDIEKTPIFR